MKVQPAAAQAIALQAERVTQVDFRIAKRLRLGRTRTLIGMDIFNALNSDTVLHRAAL